MKFAGMIRGLAVCLAIVGFCLPQPLLAAVQTNQTPAATDLALHRGAQGNVLTGQVLDPQGAPQANTPVFLLARGQKLAEATTNQNGAFAFANLRGGVYQVVSTDPDSWNPGSNPEKVWP